MPIKGRVRLGTFGPYGGAFGGLASAGRATTDPSKLGGGRFVKTPRGRSSPGRLGNGGFSHPRGAAQPARAGAPDVAIFARTSGG